MRDLGATVLKIEPAVGDPLRRFTASGAPLEATETGALFEFLNGGKESITLSEVGPTIAGAEPALPDERADGYVRSAQVVIAPAGLPLAESDAVVLRLSAFGSGGPWRELAATEFTLAAWSGAPYSRGGPDRPPVASGVEVGAYATGVMTAALAIAHLGRPVELDVSTLECLILINGHSYATRQLSSSPPPAQRNIETPSIEPAADGYVGFAIVTAQQLRDFWLLIGKPEWIDHPDFLSMRQRWIRRDEVNQAVHRWTSAHTVREIVEAAALLRIPVVPVGNGAVLPTIDQLQATEAYVRGPRGYLQPSPPFRFSRCETAPPAPAPALGASSGYVWPEPPSAAGCTHARPAPSATGGTHVSHATASPAPAPASIGAASSAARPLEGLRVCSFTAYWAGPYVACALAALGADVVLVESVQRPDGMRFMSTRAPTDDRWWEFSGTFHGVNVGKRGLTADIDHPAGRAIVEALIARSDVVVENYSPRVMENFGLDYNAVRGIKPDIVMARMPAFGLSGPWRDRTGFAMTIEQLSGLAWLTGYEDSVPMVPRGPCDPIAGMHTLVAVLAALEHRRRTGEGQLVEVSMIGAAINVTAAQVLEYGAYGRLLQRRGNRSDHSLLQDFYRCADLPDTAASGRDTDQYVAVCAETADQLHAIVAVTGEAPDVDGAVRAFCLERSPQAVVDALWPAGVPVAALAPMSCTLDNPQLRARNFFETHHHELAGDVDYATLPAVSVRNGEVIKEQCYERAAPTLGQHNSELLGELGYDSEAITGLAELGVIGTTPRGASKPI